MRQRRAVLLMLGAAAVALVAWHVDPAAYASVVRMRTLVDAHAPYGGLVFIAVCIAGIFLHLPEIVLIAVGGVLFEPLHAFAYGWVAVVAGATSLFLIVRHLARDGVRRAVVDRFPRLGALDGRLERHGFRTVLVLRLVLFLAPPLNWALGVSRVRTRDYVGATALGVVPGIGATVMFADSIAGHAPGEHLLAGRVLVAVGLLVGFLVVAGMAGRRLLDGGPDGPTRRRARTSRRGARRGAGGTSAAPDE
jgi:uncharacterized membrane protein YdjX (TVP38/TMEM64 family)